ncbi:hypothetical protein [Pontibacter sp. H249]|uniref:hypothetical protein n=1 Tax=Pontibacter sp. H249 TaxID=3133420 RepID=UPI0030C4CB9C
MAKFIELCGSPGVGKSTIFRELEKRIKKHYNCSTASTANPMGNEDLPAFGKRVIASIRGGKKYLNSRLETDYEFIRRIYKEVKNGRNHVDPEVLKAAGDRFVAQYPEYVNACWGNIFYKQSKSANGLDLRFEKTEWIYRIIKKVQVIKENKTHKTIIIDEGLVNMIDRGLYKSDDPIEEEQEIYSLLNVMPLPDALVYIHTDVRENADRLLTREVLRDMHKGLAHNELMEYTQRCRERIMATIKYLEFKGVPVLYIDATKPIKYNAQAIIDFASNLKFKEASVAAKASVLQ